MSSQTTGPETVTVSSPSVVGLGLLAAVAWLAFVHRELYRTFFDGSTGGRVAPLAVARAA